MNPKLKYYCDLAEQSASDVTSKRGNWTNFLDSAAKMYKYSFAEQLLLHAQKPGAEACASMNTWNKKFSRYVRRGTKGIALIDEASTRPKLRYVFDVDDTQVFINNAPNVNLWKLKEEHKPLVLSELAKIYDDVSDSISDTFHNIASQLATEYYNDNAREIGFRTENSYLEDYDEDNRRVAFVESATVSIAYVLMTRCGFDTDDYFTEEDFNHITNFNTLDLIHSLGEATSDLSEQVLRDVELVVKKYERQKANETTKNQKNERTVENEYTNKQTPNNSGEIWNGIHSGGGLSSTQHSVDGRPGGETLGQIWDDEESISEGESQNNLRTDAVPREVIPSLQRNGGIGGSEVITGDERTDSTSEPTQQRNIPDGLDSGNEHVESPSRGNGVERTDLRRYLEQENTLSQVGTNPQLTQALSISSITLDEVDFILRDGGNDHNSILRIAAHFAKNLSLEENTTFLKDEYLKGRYRNHRDIETGKGFVFSSNERSVWFDETGMKIGSGKSALSARDFVILTWEQVAERSKQLYDTGLFVNHDVLEEALHKEYVEVAEELLDLYRDDFNGFRNVPESWGWGNHGWPETVSIITDLLKDSDKAFGYHAILEQLSSDVVALSTENSAPTRFWHDPHRILNDLKKLSIEPQGFPVADIPFGTSTRFITNDEVDSYLIQGSNVSESKMRILSHYLNNHTHKENIDFLKNEYGHGGGSWSGVSSGWHEATPSKGIIMKRKGCKDVHLRWENVSKRMRELIHSGRYMTQIELDRIPSYEKIILARQIKHFFYGVPEDTPYQSPFPKELDFYYPKQEEWDVVLAFTESMTEVDSCLRKMQYLLENTSTKDRRYESRKTAFENLTTLRNGTYTLFPGIDKLPTPDMALISDSYSISTPSVTSSSEPTFTKSNQSQQITIFEFNALPTLPSVEEQKVVLEQSVSQNENSKPKNAINLQSVIEIEPTPREKPLPEIQLPLKLDFESVAQQVLMDVMEDESYKEALTLAQSRGSLRGTCTLALENLINSYEYNFPEVYQRYFNDDDFNEELFNFILKQSWENRSIDEVEPSQLSEPTREVVETITTPEITDAAIKQPPLAVGMPITKNIVNTFTKYDRLLYATTKDGTLYISNGYYVIKTDIKDINIVLDKINSRFRNGAIEATESLRILESISEIKSNFELTQKPYELTEGKYNACVYADEKQYFLYNKSYVDVFNQVGNVQHKFYVDDNTTYDVSSHNLIIKDQQGGVLGFILPVKVDEALYKQLADVLPLKIPYKKELDRIRENPTNDPYIGREFFDGKNTHIISGITKVNENGVYLAPTIEDDKLSRSAMHIKPEDMENQIALWEGSRVSTEKQQSAKEIKDQEEATAKSEFDDVNGFADNLSPMQKARVVNALNEPFYTKDYGNISYKKFIETAVKENKTFEIAKPMKKKYREMDKTDYFKETTSVFSQPDKITANTRYNEVLKEYDSNSWQSLWLKNNHPFLHYLIFHDKTVLDDRYFNTEYRLLTGENSFYEINKTAYDYGMYLIDSDILENHTQAQQNNIDNNLSIGEDILEPSELAEQVRNDLLERGFVVSDELIEIGLSEYTHGRGDFQDIADFIENEYLSEEIETITEINEDIPQEEYVATKTSPTPNFRITDDDLGVGGAKTKFKANIEAIKTLQIIESEKRYATPEEQAVLSQYVGWGGIQEAFDSTKEQWTKEYTELKEILTPTEYESAKESVLNAYYTSPTVIKAIYETVERLGFKTGNLLEPSMGVGNFFGLIPESMANSKLYGVELDSISVRIAKQLYPIATIKGMGYEKTDFPDSFFDVAIGNVPFGDYGVVDKRYDKHNLKIHDYFFTKTLDQVRPGGIVAFITSKGTLDKANPDVRKYLAKRADLLGAVRLPNTAFKANAGTEVTSDIIFLQKRDRMIDIEPDWVHLGQVDNPDNPGKPIAINRYFADNPEMILGTMTTDSDFRMYGNENTTTCVPIEGEDLAEQLKTALFNVVGQITEATMDDLDGSTDVAIPADPNVKNFSYTVVDDKVYFRENSMMYPVDQPTTTLERIKGMIGLRDCVRKLIDAQVSEGTEEDIQAKQRELNDLYDKFTAEYGLINSTANNRAFATGQFSDNAYYLLCSLEILDDDGNFKRKGDMFTKRTIKQKKIVTHVDTASEALAVSMGERAKVDMAFMSELTGKDEDTLFNELQGVIYKDFNGFPDGTFTYVTADEFLSGNIRKKLAKFQQGLEYTVETHPNYPTVKHHASALEKAMPKALEAQEINLRLGSTWIAPHYVQQFMYELLQTSWQNQKIYQVRYHTITGEWQVTSKGKASYGDINATVTYGTKRANAYQIIDDTLNLRDVRIYDYRTDADGKEVRELNKKETTVAQQKQEQIKQAFKEWVFKDPKRRQELVQFYNEKFNSTRPREYDGSHIVFSGISPEIRLRPHQLNAIAHILYGGNTLLAHEVGAGKTFEIVAAAMESKRLGLCSKSLIAVPNHLTEQWASEFLRLYPSANILVATRKDFEMRNRRKFIAKIATGEYDAVIIGHTQLEKIPLSMERQQRILREQINEIADGIDELQREKGDRLTIKQMAKTKKNLEVRIQKLMEGKKRDDVVTFEELGVDRLYVDESHNFKNLMMYSKMRNVAGLSTSDAQKSTDLFMKCRYMDEITTALHGRPCGTIFATGTPISNSIAEMYTVQRYLQYDLLMEHDFTHFDSWASTYCEPQTSIELSPEGNSYRARTRLSTFHNLPELMNMFKEVADIQTADMLNLPVPEVRFETIIAEPSELQKEMVQQLSERATAVQKKQVDARVDNMLKITTDGRKIGLDQRLVNAMLPDFEGSKINACTDNVYRIWEETKKDRSTQLIFCDFSTPNKDGRFNVYEDIRAKLIERGIPENELSFIHDAHTETKKKELFAKVRQGKVRILFGSTAKMGAGSNVQDKLIAIHDADCPWRPSDLTQRAGRIVRQGNTNKEVQIFRYATSQTFDSYLWQTVEAKQKFISQIMTSKSPVRSCEDVDETALSYAEIKALCAGNPLIAEKMNLDIEVAKLRMIKADYQSQHYRLEDQLLTHYPKLITLAKETITNIESDLKLYEQYNTKSTDIQLQNNSTSVTAVFVGMTINGVTYTEKEPAGKALLDACHSIKSTDETSIGKYMGFNMKVQFDSFNKSFKLILKGKTSHTIDLGTDTFGNITRINNLLSSFPEKLENAKNKLVELESQQQSAKAELGKPFHLSDELSEKELKLAAINNQLDIGIDVEVDEEVNGSGENPVDEPKVRNDDDMVI